MKKIGAFLMLCSTLPCQQLAPQQNSEMNNFVLFVVRPVETDLDYEKCISTLKVELGKWLTTEGKTQPSELSWQIRIAPLGWNKLTVAVALTRAPATLVGQKIPDHLIVNRGCTDPTAIIKETTDFIISVGKRAKAPLR